MGNPVSNTLMVWKALFLKDALSRFFGNRAAWAWLIIEPAMHILVMVIMFTVIRTKKVGGVDVASWLMVGMLLFFLFRRTGVQSLHALDCNKAFFAFRQVRPFDAAISACLVELFSMGLVSVFISIVFAFIGYQVIPIDILYLLAAILGTWLLGLGYGLISSVCMRIVRDSGHILQIIMAPLMFISGVILPVNNIPEPYRSYLLLNPLLHAIECARLSYWDTYHTLDVSLCYLYSVALVMIVVGMALYRALETRLVAQ